ncbi:hypothetical protein GCM10023216_09430 [Isoptericola chiayiensis]|uniref:Cupin type-2 domain-containing protein n=1 Tax=Isoptericola chiayiensis TaxID=579446 RepID=A0ABP8Y704_9MICO|nr:cupin domain-containing protein [Isoptericola chiayiensis]NOW00582.1 quercetin dioxygenase-like cupin family protein [Isoptericola chiayiensis]
MTTAGPRTTPLRRRRPATLLAALLVATTAAPAAAEPWSDLVPQVEDAPPPIGVEVLSGHADFPDDVGVTIRRKLSGERRDQIRLKDAGTIVVARLTVQPGARFPWHTHPGPVVVSVVDGDLVYQQASDCVERDYTSSEAFVDPGDEVHTAWNPGDAPTLLMATFYGVPDGGPVTIPVTDPPDYCNARARDDHGPRKPRIVGPVPGWFSMR